MQDFTYNSNGLKRLRGKRPNALIRRILRGGGEGGTLGPAQTPHSSARYTHLPGVGLRAIVVPSVPLVNELWRSCCDCSASLLTPMTKPALSVGPYRCTPSAEWKPQ